MKTNKALLLIGVTIVFSLFLSACGTPAVPTAGSDSDQDLIVVTEEPNQVEEDTTPQEDAAPETSGDPEAYPAPDDAAQTDPDPEGYPAPEGGVSQPSAADLGEIASSSSQTEGYPPPVEAPAPGQRALPAAPMPFQFPSEDGTLLTGVLYPAAQPNAPLVILYHQYGGEKGDWEDLAIWLQNRKDELSSTAPGVLAAIDPGAGYPWFPDMDPRLGSFNVFAADFRGHGESEGTLDYDAAAFLMDARAIMAFAKGTGNADPNRIITMGASIGADASVDVCVVLDDFDVAPQDQQVSQNCLGTLSFSPGDFLTVPFADAITALGQSPHNTFSLCLIAENDGAETCVNASSDHYVYTVYPGNNHGTALIEPGLSPDIGLRILNFLLEVFGFGGA